MILKMLLHFPMKFLQANRITTDGTPRFAASRPGIYCLSMFHTKDARLKRVNIETENPHRSIDYLDHQFSSYQHF